MDIRALAEKYSDYIIERRRFYHSCPELSFQEWETTKSLIEDVKAMGLEVQAFDDYPGFIATLDTGKPGKTVMLRSDIDALPVNEKTGLPFASKNEGVMHACGHDNHMAMLLGAAKILCDVKDEIAGGKVKFIFQSGEEMGYGAKYYVEHGCLDDVDAIFGMHIWGTLDAPYVSVDGGNRMASMDNFTIKVKGHQSHGSAPQDGHDAIAFLAEHAEEYGYDASQCAVWGESAGGYLACITAVTEQAIPVKALVDYYGIVDFATTDRQFAEQGIPSWVRKIANGWASPDLLGGFNSCEEFWVRKAYADWTEEDLKNFSVPYHASLGLNPGLKSMLLHGDADITVPNAQSAEMLDALVAVGGAANAELYTLHGLMHAADAFYTDTQLGRVESFVRSAMGIS